MAALVGAAVAPKMLPAMPVARSFDIASAYPSGAAVGIAASAAPSDHVHAYFGGQAEFFFAE